MVKGNKPIPTGIKRLRGNTGKRPLPRNEPEPGGVAVCPEHLGEIAAAEWDRVSVELRACGLLTAVDQSVLAAYCVAFERWVEAETRMVSAVLTTDKGNMIQNPWLSIANRAMEQMVKFAAEFGMSPSARTRVAAQAPDNNDKLAAFLGRIA